MKSIKSFKYKKEKHFIYFLEENGGCNLDGVKGFDLSSKKQNRGNVLKTYCVYFNDGEREYFQVAIFKSFNEYRQSGLGFNGNKLLSWYQDADIAIYK